MRRQAERARIRQSAAASAAYWGNFAAPGAPVLLLLRHAGGAHEVWRVVKTIRIPANYLAQFRRAVARYRRGFAALATTNGVLLVYASMGRS
jgi:hypothetical protein